MTKENMPEDHGDNGPHVEPAVPVSKHRTKSKPALPRMEQPETGDITDESTKANPAAKKTQPRTKHIEEPHRDSGTQIIESLPAETGEMFRRNPQAVVDFLAQEAKMSEQQVRSLLKELAPDMPEEERNKFIEKAKFASQEKEVEPAPEEKAKLAKMGHDLEVLAPEAQNIMYMSEGKTKEEAKQSFKDKIRGISASLGEDTGKVLGKVMKYTTITSGIFLILFVFLLSWHSSSGKH